MKYTYLLPSLVLAGVVVIGVDATDDSDTGREEQTLPGKETRSKPVPVIPPILVKLELSEEQEEVIRELMDRAAIERRLVKDRNTRRAIQKRYDDSLMALLTEKQRSLLQRLRTPRHS